MLLRRSIATRGAGDGVVTVVVRLRTARARPGCRRCRRGAGRRGRAAGAGRSRCREPGTPALVVGGGYGRRRWWGLAARLRRARLGRSPSVTGAASADRLCSVDELGEVATPVGVTTDDGSAGRKGWVTDAVAELIGDAGVGLRLRADGDAAGRGRGGDGVRASRPTSRSRSRWPAGSGSA